MFAAGFCQNEAAVRKIECGEILTTAKLCLRRAPVKTTGNHQMKYEPKIALEANGDALTDPSQLF